MVRKLRTKWNDTTSFGSPMQTPSVDVAEVDRKKIRELVESTYREEIASLARARDRKRRLDRVLQMCAPPTANDAQPVPAPDSICNVDHELYNETIGKAVFNSSLLSQSIVNSAESSNSFALDWKAEEAPPVEINLFHPAIAIPSKTTMTTISTTERPVKGQEPQLLNSKSSLFRQTGSDLENSVKLISTKKSIRLDKNVATASDESNLGMGLKLSHQPDFKENPKDFKVGRGHTMFNDDGTSGSKPGGVLGTEDLSQSTSETGHSRTTCNSSIPSSGYLDFDVSSSNSKRRAIKANNILNHLTIPAKSIEEKDRAFIQI